MKRGYLIPTAVLLSVFLFILPAAAEECSHVWENFNHSPWSSNYQTYNATLVCSVCDETAFTDFIITARIIAPPECNSPGIIEYTAVANASDVNFSDSKIDEAEILGHNYGEPQFHWSNDNTSASVSASCSRCSSTDTLTAAVSPDITPATCESAGCIVYTASITLSGSLYQEQKNIILPQTEHRYSVPNFQWENDLCNAHYSCLICDETYTDACTITEQNIWNNCTDPGVCITTAAITLNGVPYTSTESKAIPAKRHSTERILGFTASCTEDGLTDGLVCSDCGEVLLEQAVIPADGHDEIFIPGLVPTCTEDGYSDRIVCGVCREELQVCTPLPAAHTVETQAAILPTCTKSGMSEGQRCSVCGEELLVPSWQPALGHLYGDASFTWNHDASSADAKKVCTRGCGVTLSGAVTLSSSVSSENGITVTTVRASAIFPDGTTAQQTKSFRSEPPSQPTAPTRPTVPDTKTFSDVVHGSYYEDAVLWATKEGITQGTGDRTFSPDMECSRAQIVTMLWRAAGSPVTVHPTAFTDVPASAYYAHAVAWASETGITAGTSATTFSPNLPCTRAQIVTMLWRAAGCPAADSTAPFTDIAADGWYTDAVAWAVDHGITQGTGSGQFSPDAVCTRAQIVTFLYRAAQIYT